MPVSIREQLMAAICAAVGGEYTVNLPTNKNDLPATIVAEEPEEAATDYGTVLINLPVIIARGDAASDTDTAIMRAEANALHAAIITEMTADETFGGLAESTLYTGGSIVADGRFVAAECQFTVRYRNVRGNPYLNEE